MHPTLTNIAEPLTVFGVSIEGLAYNSTVLPVIFGIIIANYLSKLFTKIIPDVVKIFLVPVFVLLITVPLIYVFIGPFANSLSDSMYNLMNSLMTFSPIVAGAVLAFTWQILVIFGIHQAVIIPSIIALSMGQKDLFMSSYHQHHLLKWQ